MGGVLLCGGSNKNVCNYAIEIIISNKFQDNSTDNTSSRNNELSNCSDDRRMTAIFVSSTGISRKIIKYAIRLERS